MKLLITVITALLISGCSLVKVPEMTPRPTEVPPETNATQAVTTPDNSKNVDKSGFIGEEKARQLALQKAGISAENAIFDKTELDNDNGVWHYEVEFRHGATEYDADIKADTGEIIKWESEIND